MTNFVAVVDPVDNRRRVFVEKIEALLPLVDGLSVNSCSVGDFSAAWAVGAWMPFDSLVDNDCAVLVFGDAIDGVCSRRVNASQLRKLWGNSELSNPLDGFHAAVTYDRGGKLIAGADLLGMFPVYYWICRDVVLVGSSPELFRYHPCFEMKLDPEGLVGILLTKGLVNGKTLLEGVKRLAAGHLLKCSSDMEAREVSQFRFPMSTKYFGMSVSEQVEVLDKSLEEAIDRQVSKNEKCCLLLSGGLDSTLLAGYLERGGYEVVAMTEGLKTDNEMKCAKQIAETLGFKHVQFHVAYNNYGHYSDVAATWQHLSEGFTSVPFWRFYRRLRKGTPHVITGFSGDAILGSMVNRCLTRRGLCTSFDSFFRNINKEAFTPKTLKKLLKKDYCMLVSRTVREIKKAHTSYPGLEFQSLWGFGLNQKTRFNDLSGIWSLSFGAWPIQPFADHKILETVGGFPIESLANRRVERELLRVKFPKLAKLSLAGGAISPIPTASGFRNKVRQQIFGNAGFWKLGVLRDIRNQIFVEVGGERRYWRRQYHFNSPEWRVVRKKAEPYLYMITKIFCKEALEELMPAADSNYLQVLLKMKSFGVNTSSSLRIVLGLTFWAKKNSDAINNFQQLSN